MVSIPFIMLQCKYHNPRRTLAVPHPIPRFADRDLFMRYRGGGVGHLATRQCNKTLLADEHTLLAEPDDEPAVPEAEPGSDEDSESEVEETYNEGHDLSGDLDDTDLVDRAGFGAL